MQLGNVDYDLLEQQVIGLLEDEHSFLANASNFAAFVFTSLPNVNWAGFYFPNPEALVLGPFGGKPACTRLPSGRGVCGKAFSGARTVIVDDVQAFPDHIVCDSASQSEMVVPLLKDGAIWGVFDIDAPVKSHFTPEDARGVERLVQRFMDLTPVPQQFRVQRDGSVHFAERLDIQTCRDHHVVLQYLNDDLEATNDADKMQDLLQRFKSVLVAHLKLEDDWLYPRLAQSQNVFIRDKAERYQREMGDLRKRFDELLKAWSTKGTIAGNIDDFKKAWREFSTRLTARVHAEDSDLYIAAEHDLA